LGRLIGRRAGMSGLLSGASAQVVLARRAKAAAYPNHSLQMIVPFARGPADFEHQARLFATDQ
jgi:tripartite-type tricarboxylate transporter receptor subunit TctC